MFNILYAVKIERQLVGVDLNSANLIDLIHERHIQLRKLTEQIWNERSEMNISNSEWYILSKIYQEKGETTISNVTKRVHVTRQATHKFIKLLEEKKLVEVKNVEHDKRVKAVKLTELGIKCMNENNAIKKELENNIAEQLGEDQVNEFKKRLMMDWGI